MAKHMWPIAVHQQDGAAAVCVLVVKCGIASVEICGHTMRTFPVGQNSAVPGLSLLHLLTKFDKTNFH